MLAETTPKATQNNTKWALKVFRDWQSSRTEKNVEFNYVGLGQVDILNVQDLTRRIEDNYVYQQSEFFA
jgi:hypothetical protein